MRASVRGEQRRDQILVAAAKLASDGGVGALSIGAVASNAGLAKSVVIYHFGGHDGLIEALYAHVASKCLAPEFGALDGADGDPREQLNRWLHAALGAAPADVAERRLWLLLRQDGGCAAVRDLATDDSLRRQRMLEALLHEGHRQYCWQSPDPGTSATTVLAFLDGIWMTPAALLEGDDLRRIGRRAVLDLLVRR